MGRKSWGKGNSLETRLDQYHTLLEARRLATVRKIPSPVQITSSRKEGKRRVVTGYTLAREWTDYAGTLAGGRAVVFEAKATGNGDERFAFDRLEGAGGEDQIDILARHARFGALTFVYVRRHTDPIRYAEYVLPVDADGSVAGIANEKGVRGTRSIRFDECADYRIGPTETWYEVLVRLGELLSAPLERPLEPTALRALLAERVENDRQFDNADAFEVLYDAYVELWSVGC